MSCRSAFSLTPAAAPRCRRAPPFPERLPTSARPAASSNGTCLRDLELMGAAARELLASWAVRRSVSMPVSARSVLLVPRSKAGTRVILPKWNRSACERLDASQRMVHARMSPCAVESGSRKRERLSCGARSVAASYKPPMLVTRVRLPACAICNARLNDPMLPAVSVVSQSHESSGVAPSGVPSACGVGYLCLSRERGTSPARLGAAAHVKMISNGWRPSTTCQRGKIQRRHGPTTQPLAMALFGQLALLHAGPPALQVAASPRQFADAPAILVSDRAHRA